MPPMSFSSFSISRLKVSCSFLLMVSRPASCWAFNSFRRLIEVLTGLKLVSWLGGLLTNFTTVKASIKRLKELKAQQEAGLETISKKEQLTFKREIEKLEKDIGGIQDMNALPDAIFVIDVGFHKIAVLEAKKLGIPLIGVVDSNHSPIGIDYVIPGNDDSSKAVALYARGLADAVLEGRANAGSDLVKTVSPESSDEFVEVQNAAV